MTYALLPTLTSFIEAFIDHYFPQKARDALVDHFLNIRLGSMSVREYALRFDSLIRYALDLIDMMKSRVHRSIEGLTSDYIEACTTAALSDTMDIS